MLRVVDQVPPGAAIHAPIEVFIKKAAEVWGAAEVIVRGRTEGLDFGLHEGFERFLLGGEFLQHGDFQLALCGRQDVRTCFAAWDGKELVGRDATGVGVIAGELHELKRCAGVFQLVELFGGVAGEGDGIVVGMAAFVGVSQDDLRLSLLEESEEAEGERF